MKKIICYVMVAFASMLYATNAASQNWQPLGANDDNQPSFSAASNIFVKTNHTGVVHVAYKDVNDLLRVRKYANNKWLDVGGTISLGGAGVPSLAFDTADIPYIAYPDYGYYQGCVNVKKYVSGSWQQVGNTCFSSTFPDNVRLVITSKDSLFVLYRDGNNNKPILKKYDANTIAWVAQSAIEISSNPIISCDLALDAQDSMYVAYTASSNNKSTVKKWSNSNWATVGNADFTTGTNPFIKLVIDAGNNPIVGYMNSAASGKLIAMKWNGSSWNAVGTTLAGTGPYDGNQIIFCIANGMLTFAYVDASTAALSVQQYNGSSWAYLGSQFLTTLNASIASLGAAPDANGDVTVLFRDGYNQQKLSAKKFTSGNWIDFETRGLAVGYMTDVRTFVDYNGIPYICYSDVINGYKACVKKFVGGNWVDVGPNGFSSYRADNLSIAFDKNSTPYVCYFDWGVTGTTVQKFNGTNWVTVGVKDFTGRSAYVPYMAMDTATSTPYVISQDDNGHFYKAIVSRFDGTNWVNVGSINFSNGRIFNPKILITSTGVPYVTYADENLNSQAIVKKFDGTNWVDVGGGSISGTFNTDYNTISLGKNDTIYAAYKDNQVSYKAVIKKFTGTSWKQLGNNVGIGSVKYLSLTNSNSGLPYIAYEDLGDGYKAYVKKYRSSDSSWIDVAATAGGITPGYADWVSLASNKTNNTFYMAYAFGDIYAKTIGLSITASAGFGGTITPSGTVDVANGTNQSYSITANGGYCIQDVVVDGVSVGAVNIYTFTNVTISHTIAASFVAQVTPSVSIAASPSNHICAGVNVTFTATPTNGGSSPMYNFFVNGNSVQSSNSNTFSSSSFNHSDDVTCTITANNSCQTTATANSNSIRLTIYPLLIPSVTLMASSNNVCSGSNITFTATATNGGSSPMYNFMVNGNSVQSSSSNTYSSSIFNNNDDVKCILTANNTCQTSATANSNIVTMQILTNVTPSVSIASNSGLNICSGSNVTFTATPVNSGSSPNYNFFLNGNSVQSSSSNTYSSSALSTNDNISCVMTSNNQCQTTHTANSNNLVMTLTANATPIISIQSNPGNTVCAGTNVVFTATPNNGGNAPTYQWKKNGNTVGTNSNTYADNNLSNNDSVWCVLTSNSVCVITPNATSNKIKMVINPTPTNLSAITGNTVSCTIGSINSLYNSTGGGVWFSDNTNVATISNVGKATSVANGNANISYTVTNAYGCSASTSTAFNVAAVTVAAINGSSNVCIGSNTLYDCPTPNGVWSVVNRGTITQAGLFNATAAGTTTISYKVTVNSCSNSATKSITINSTPIAYIGYAPSSVNPSAGGGNFCANRTVQLTGTANGTGGNGVWSKVGTLTISATGLLNTGNVASSGNSVTFTYTDGNGCTGSRSIGGNIVICAGRGSQQSLVSSQWSIYPNPTKGLIHLKVERLSGAGIIIITDLYGKQLSQQPLSIGINTIDLSGLVKGLYLVSVLTEEGKETRKIIVD